MLAGRAVPHRRQGASASELGTGSPAARRARASARCSPSGSPRSATPAIPVSASTWCGSARSRASAAIRCRPASPRPTMTAELAHLVDRLGARFGLRRVTRLVPQDTHIPEFAVAAMAAHAVSAMPSLWGGSAAKRPGEGQRDAGASRQASPPSPPIPLQGEGARERATHSGLARPDPPDPSVRTAGADRGHRGSAGRPAGAVHLAARAPCRGACRRARAHRHGMVARRRKAARSRATISGSRASEGMRVWLYREGFFDDREPPSWFLHGVFRMSTRGTSCLFPPGERPRDETPDAPAYAELAVTTNFSFLRGGSHPEELVERAQSTGHWRASASPIAIRWPASCARTCRAEGGCRRRQADEESGSPSAHVSSSPTARPTSSLIRKTGRHGDGLRACLTVGKSRAEKGECILFHRRSARAHRGPQSHRHAAAADQCRQARRPARTS